MSLKKKIVTLLWGLAATGFMTCATIMGVTTGVTTSACDPMDAGDAGDAAAATSSSSGIATSPTQLRLIDYQTLCNRLITECTQPLALGDCRKSYETLLVTADCNSLLANTATTTCSDLLDPNSTANTTCFPPCTGTIAACDATDAGQLTRCSPSGNSQVDDCNLACVAAGSSYSGTCGTTFKDQVSEAPQCWCD